MVSLPSNAHNNPLYAPAATEELVKTSQSYRHEFGGFLF